MNSFTISGRLTKDVEAKTTQSGKEYAKFTVADQHKFKTDGEYGANFFNCTIWGNNVEFCKKNLKKGMFVCVIGELTLKDYQDRDDIRRTAIEVNVRDIQLCFERNADNERIEQPKPKAKSKMEVYDDLGEDSPF